MIVTLLKVIQNGVLRMRQHGQLVFVALLVFVFPIIFLYTTQSFLDTAYTNIQTAEKQRVGMLQDVIATFLWSSAQPNFNVITELSHNIKNQNTDINEIRLIQKVPEGLLILSSLDESKIGTLEPETDSYTRTPIGNDQSYIYEFTKDRERLWQTIRHLELSDGTEYYIFSEHSFARIDKTIASRKYVAYGALMGIFVFLIGLAYWLMRQIDWKTKYTELHKILEERDLLTNMIAHEFRTPLTAIKGYGSLLGDSKTLQVNERDYLSKMLISSDRLLALVNDFLEVARIQSGRMKLDIETVDVRSVCAEVAAALTPIATEHGIELRAPEIGDPIMFMTDKKRLFQIIQNLVSNALKYTEKGLVTFSVEAVAQTITLRVKDTGTGISAEDQQKLFVPFSRVGGVEKTGITGTGLGMWITKQYVELLGGVISVESIKSVGTHIIVTFKHKK